MVEIGIVLFAVGNAKYRVRLQNGGEATARVMRIGQIFPHYKQNDRVFVLRIGNQWFIIGGLPTEWAEETAEDGDVVIQSEDALLAMHADGSITISGAPTAELGIVGPKHLVWIKAENLNIASTYMTLYAQTLPTGGMLSFSFELLPGVSIQTEWNAAAVSFKVGPLVSIDVVPTTGMVTVKSGAAQINVMPTGQVILGMQGAPKGMVCNSVTTICPFLGIPHIGTPNVLAG